MSPTVTLTCPSCGAQLKITDGIDKFVCAHCGTEQIVKRLDGSVYIKPIIDNLNTIKGESNLTSNYLREQRIVEEIKFIKKERRKENQITFVIFLISGIFSLIFIGAIISGFRDGFGDINFETIFGLILVSTAGITSIVVIFMIIKNLPKSRKEYLKKIENKERELRSHL